MLVAVGILAIGVIGFRFGVVSTGSPDAVGADQAVQEKTPRPTPSAGVTPDIESEAELPPPPPVGLAYMDKSGFLSIPVWDDRHISDEAKDNDPWVNPRWAPFNRCMNEAGGYGVADAQTLKQDDIDGIQERINADGPFLERTAGGPSLRMTPGLASFLECAAATLEVGNEELGAILLPGDPTGEMPR